MDVRIVAGSLRGRKIRLSGAAASIRPSKDIVRKAVADSVAKRIVGATVADMCAGTGAWGFEMISRGAKRVSFVESDRTRCKILLEHAVLFKVEERCRVVCDDVRRFVGNTQEKFDLIFYDPPYDDTDLFGQVSLLLPCLTKQGMLVYEHDRDIDPPLVPADIMSRRCNYGKTSIEYYSVATNQDAEIRL